MTPESTLSVPEMRPSASRVTFQTLSRQGPPMLFAATVRNVSDVRFVSVQLDVQPMLGTTIVPLMGSVLDNVKVTGTERVWSAG
ncbi:hypothetical protein A9W99_22190 [Mycobacterium sp. 1164966.3]|uniref:hypothetical protein n=1 Tax=Mycobacterium sp. 1164966.3 TaxID=1856861 RepID=UPI0007FF666C|nr:hypothetical protein [Mycobacterium sp. 1164966.3]OBA78820.1 hypothetical protein A9W99_22190 [Mycobacterium sp. 1164966.3]